LRGTCQVRLRQAVPGGGNHRRMALGGWLAHAQILGRSRHGFNHNYLTGLNFLDGFYIRRRMGLEYSRSVSVLVAVCRIPRHDCQSVPSPRVHRKKITRTAG
jgi:hypothetical protein